jgi:hypothetical protein
VVVEWSERLPWVIARSGIAFGIEHYYNQNFKYLREVSFGSVSESNSAHSSHQ